MVDIYTYVDELLATLDVPFYMGGSELDEFPDTWIEYTITERPALMSDDTEQETQYTISLLIYSSTAAPQLCQSIKALFSECAPKGGGYAGEIEEYPPRKIYALDFVI